MHNGFPATTRRERLGDMTAAPRKTNPDPRDVSSSVVRSALTALVLASCGGAAATTTGAHGPRSERTVAAVPGRQAIALTNTGAKTAEFELTHNGHLAFNSMNEVLAAVRALPDEIPNEGLERKIWRFVRDNVYHAEPLNDDTWLLESWGTLNSAGWGLCSHVSETYASIATAAGFEVRIWALSGHVVPEVKVKGHWEVYDPDLAVYYFTADGVIAGVQELSADPSLVSSPRTPLFPPGKNDDAYRAEVADIYSSKADNQVADWFASKEPFHGSQISLPAGSRFVYPGRWTANPIGYDGERQAEITSFREARLEIPADRTGPIDVAFVLADVQGSGTIRIDGKDYAVGSDALRTFLARPGHSITTIEIVDNPSGIAMVMLVNALWFDLANTNHLVLQGSHVGDVTSASVELPAANQPPDPVPTYLHKPRPKLVGASA